MSNDLRRTGEYAAVAEYMRLQHEPAFGRPHTAAEPAITADGAYAVVTGSVFEELTGTPRTALYAVRDGGLRAITAGPGSARCGRFSPDGRTLSLLSDRARRGVFQLYLLAADGFGEAAATPQVPGTVEYADWSPDGQRILLCVAGLGADLAGGQGSGSTATDDQDLPSWHPVVEADVPANAWRSVWLYVPGTGELTRLSPDGMNCWEAGWCGPDQVVAITSSRPGEDDWYRAVLTLLHCQTGEIRELLASDVQLALPCGAPGGDHAAVVMALCSDRRVVAGELVVVDLRSGAQQVVGTAGTDVTWVNWIDDDRIGYLGLRQLDSVAGIAELAGGSVTELAFSGLSCGVRYPEGSFTCDGRVLVVQDAYDQPPQVALLSPDKDEVLASLAHPGTDYLLSIAGHAQAVSWQAPDGLEIQGIVCSPPGPGPFPLIVNIHGGPVWAFRDRWSMNFPLVPLLVSRGYAVLHPNPRGSSGRGQEFARLVVGDMGGADARDVLVGIDALVERGVADPARIGLFGASYGGFMSSWLVTIDQRFAAAVPMSPVTDWYSQSFTSNIASWGIWFLGTDPEQSGGEPHRRSPALRASQARTPCLNVAGARDRCTPPDQAREFHQALVRQGVESVLVIYPEEGHGVRNHPAITDVLTRITSWFERHMPPGPAG